ncbi:MAG: hypothetical protein FWF09_00500 [Bacteroidales bacterium]|nr:hypothetical protein [Bacteroidales bacterium]
MKAFKIMSIAGLALFWWLLIILILLLDDEGVRLVDDEGVRFATALGLGALAVLYAVPYSIVGLVKSGKNATLKVMSIIGVSWFGLLLLMLLSSINDVNDIDEMLGLGLFVLLYAVPYSIVGLVQSIQATKKPLSTHI